MLVPYLSDSQFIFSQIIYSILQNSSFLVCQASYLFPFLPLITYKQVRPWEGRGQVDQSFQARSHVLLTWTCNCFRSKWKKSTWAPSAEEEEVTTRTRGRAPDPARSRCWPGWTRSSTTSDRTRSVCPLDDVKLKLNMQHPAVWLKMRFVIEPHFLFCSLSGYHLLYYHTLPSWLGRQE